MERKKIGKKKENLSGEEKAFIERRKRQTGKQGEREPARGWRKSRRERTGEEEKRREHRGRRRPPEGFPKLQSLPRELRGAP